MLVSDGYSIDEIAVEVERALTGGSGVFEGATGVQLETSLGLNATGGMNFQQEIHISG